jgi:hypothetical protein
MAQQPQLTKDQEIEALKKRLEDLTGELAEANAASAAAMGRAAFFADANTEIPTGRKVSLEYCENPWVKDEAKQVWKTKEVDTYLFKVEMPPVGGVQIVLDGEPLQHGQTYEVTLDRLRYLKEIVFRLQAHEASIHGNDDDVWRPRISKEINLRSGTIRNLPPNWMPGAR